MPVSTATQSLLHPVICLSSSLISLISVTNDDSLVSVISLNKGT